MEKPLLSVKYFKEGASCSQAILATYGSSLGLTQEECYRIGAGLGGGIGRRQYICGAINAGAIIIGLKHGNSELSDNNKKEITSKLVSEFVVECENAIGGVQCSELLKIDLNNPEQKMLAKESGLFDRVCNNAVERTAEILEKYLK